MMAHSPPVLGRGEAPRCCLLPTGQLHGHLVCSHPEHLSHPVCQRQASHMLHLMVGVGALWLYSPVPVPGGVTSHFSPQQCLGGMTDGEMETLSFLGT